MMRPYWSLEVSFWCDSFQPTTWICPLCPSSVWFMDKLEGAAKPFTFPSFPASSLSQSGNIYVHLAVLLTLIET